ncbi:hypothetical protein JXA80_08620, partial [bacterium]|nr:hypothetical protein [candidate division CSSED10-310 bacterium]
NPSSGWQSVSVEIPVVPSGRPYQDVWFQFSSGTAPAEIPGGAAGTVSDQRRLSAALTDPAITNQSSTNQPSPPLIGSWPEAGQ